MKKKIESGIYLVIDPSMDEISIIEKLGVILNEKIATIQIWDHFPKNQNIEKLLEKIWQMGSKANVPVIINNRWKYLKDIPLDGVHFDEFPDNLPQIKEEINRDFISGITCMNDMSTINRAADYKIDYISFCSMFPSSSADDCEIVDFESVRKAREIFKGPIFLAGGIKPDNMEKLASLDYNGIAVISGIMSAEDPAEAIRAYNNKLKSKHEKEDNK